MEVRILHIDDEPDILEKAAEIITGTQIEGHTLIVRDSCGFDEGMQKLAKNSYDLVILDLCVGKASSASDKVGEAIFKQIKERAFVPVVFFTGLPEYVRDLESNIVRIAGKAQGFDELFTGIKQICSSGVLELKAQIDDIVKEGLRSYFWDFVHPSSAVIESLKKDDVSLKYLLLRRLGKTLSTEMTRKATAEETLKKSHSHPMEFYIFPPMDGEYETGDLVRKKETDELSVILTPACDLILRHDTKKRKAEKILLVNTIEAKKLFFDDLKKIEELNAKQRGLEAEGKTLAKEEAGQLKNLPDKIKNKMRPGWNDRYFFLPSTFFCPGVFVDFEHKQTLSYQELDEQYEVVATIDDPIIQSILSGYARYYSRIGYQDLDIDYAFELLSKK